MDIQVDDPEWLALWVVALLSFLLVSLPMLLGMLGLTRVRKTCDYGAEITVSPNVADQYEVLVGQLRELGFEALGVKRTAVRFHSYHWLWRCESQVFGSRRLGCYAAVYQLAPGERLRVCLTSVFADGSIVQTGNSLKQLLIEEDDHFRSGLPTSDMNELVKGHQRTIAESPFAARTLVPLDLQLFAERETFFDQRTLMTLHRDLPFKMFKVFLTFVGAIAIPTFLAFGIAHWLLPLAIGVGAISFKVAMPLLRRAAGRVCDREDKNGGESEEEFDDEPKEASLRESEGVTQLKRVRVTDRG